MVKLRVMFWFGAAYIPAAIVFGVVATALASTVRACVAGETTLVVLGTVVVVATSTMVVRALNAIRHAVHAPRTEANAEDVPIVVVAQNDVPRAMLWNAVRQLRVGWWVHPVRQIIIDIDLNAGAWRTMPASHTSETTIQVGLPILAAMDRSVSDVILAHELGHLQRYRMMSHIVAWHVPRASAMAAYVGERLWSRAGTWIMRCVDAVAALYPALRREEELEADRYAVARCGVDASVRAYLSVMIARRRASGFFERWMSLTTNATENIPATMCRDYVAAIRQPWTDEEIEWLEERLLDVAVDTAAHYPSDRQRLLAMGWNRLVPARIGSDVPGPAAWLPLDDIIERWDQYLSTVHAETWAERRAKVVEAQSIVLEPIPAGPAIHTARWALALAYLGRYEESLALVDAYLADVPADATWRYHRGVMLRTMGRYEEAALIFDDLMQTAPTITMRTGAYHNLEGMHDVLLRQRSSVLRLLAPKINRWAEEHEASAATVPKPTVLLTIEIAEEAAAALRAIFVDSVGIRSVDMAQYRGGILPEFRVTLLVVDVADDHDAERAYKELCVRLRDTGYGDLRVIPKHKVSRAFLDGVRMTYGVPWFQR